MSEVVKKFDYSISDVGISAIPIYAEIRAGEGHFTLMNPANESYLDGNVHVHGKVEELVPYKIIVPLPGVALPWKWYTPEFGNVSLPVIGGKNYLKACFRISKPDPAQAVLLVEGGILTRSWPSDDWPQDPSYIELFKFPL